MSDLHFRFSSDKQREQNTTGKIREENIPVRKSGRHQFSVTIDLKMGYLKNFSYPEGIAAIRYGVKDPVTKDVIPPETKEYNNFHPVNCTFIASEVNPDPLARYTEQDLYNWLNDTFGKYITNWNLTEKEEPNMKTFAFGDIPLFKHEGIMEVNEATGQENINKNMFNVRTKMILQHEIDALNNRLEIMGFEKPIKKSDALMATEKTINTPSKLYYEYGDF